ncbi:hypothetical protein SAMN05216188_11993 [Lentzea xinjiangensis]|uniref:HNH endonuclease n=1 Tax=Lentzea xinjiangensis TaxID=402600 RepID=A0A1H9TVE9_9PSEU|nr:hypothetical protein [Lentzea xinjiangensis]SES01069.1 hypothetical protein SAMN05216188_11993 [Lentzea xinjiangensis]
MTEEKRRDFSNLILLCGYHHEVVDGEETRDEYTVEMLTEWKTARESELGVDLSPLNGVLNEGNLEAR